MSEKQRARLHRLADSINDTARMARTSLSLMLLVALYSVLTLVASTDQNLLLNGQVTLPQIGGGISVAQSYILAPLIFLYLHIQLLFLLSVLAGKISTFEGALKKEFPDALLPRLQNKVEVKREECWEWLSAFAFVQLFRQTPGARRVLNMVARTLVWFGIEAVPLVLLFVIDVSFVRYQSDWITRSHHCIFILDLVSIGIFNWFVLPRRDRRQWKSSHRSSALRLDRWRSVKGTVVILGRVWTLVGLIVSLCMALLLICYAHPPQFNPQSVEDDRKSIWRGDDREFWQAMREFRQAMREFRQAVWHRGENLLDAGPCRWWGFGCRYLDVRKKWLLGAQPQDLVDQISDESTSETGEDIRRFGLGSPDLAGRRFRFARFESAYLPGADLHQTELQGADLAEAELQEANLVGAELQGVKLVRAKLQGANLRGAELQGADLGLAELQGANLSSAKLYGAGLAGAELQGANLTRAALQGTYLAWAKLQGANLSYAELHGADLTGAELQGADLLGAKLHGADLTKTEFQGTNLAKAALQGSRGLPASWYLTWMPCVSFDLFDLSKYLEKFLSDEIKDAKLAWEDLTLQEHLKQSLSCRCPDREIFSVAKPKDTDMVFHTLKDQNSKDKNCPAVPNVNSEKDQNWPDAPDINSDDYWTAWAEWTADFACENEYTARSSLQRWSLLSLNERWEKFMSISPGPPFGQKIPECAKEKVREAILKASKGRECPGFYALTEDERKMFVDGQPAPGRAKPVCNLE